MLTNKVSLSASLIFSICVTVSFSNPDTTVLLSFRAESDLSNSLASWVNTSDPCSGSWLGVSCYLETGRVTGLVLEDLNLTGSTRLLSQLTHLRHLSLKLNRLSDNSSSLNLSSWPNLKHLYLSHNRFAGEFPSGISRLRRLQRLDLSHNGFSGKIPVAELAQLPRLLTVRLESNSFDGELGTANLSYRYLISDFNVSGNNLSGEIPSWLSRFDATSFGGNQRLCGRPLQCDCSKWTDQNEPQTSDKNDSGSKYHSAVLPLTTIICAVVAAVLAATGVTVIARRWRKRSTCVSRDGHSSSRRQYGPRNCDGEGMVLFDGCKKGIGGVDDLLGASAEMLGKGSVGTTYKVVMDGGDAVVVKRVTERRVGKEADWWLREVVGSLRHPNIVSLRAYHRSQNHDDQPLLLVYDLLPNGSLHHLLHGNRGPGRTPLDWPTRLKLASDTARGLAFIHHLCANKMKLFHGHLTSSNILVDHLGNAYLSDTCLHQILRVPLSPLSAYTAPELVTLSTNNPSSTPRKFTHKCDVYSFGVVLLEILTGKMASDVDVGEGAGLVKWFRTVGREGYWSWQVLDVELLRNKETEKQIMALAQVALLCLAFSPKDRPTMSVVHRMIEDIRTEGVRREHQQRAVMDHLIITSIASSSPSSSSSN